MWRNLRLARHVKTDFSASSTLIVDSEYSSDSPQNGQDGSGSIADLLDLEVEPPRPYTELGEAPEDDTVSTNETCCGKTFSDLEPPSEGAVALRAQAMILFMAGWIVYFAIGQLDVWIQDTPMFEKDAKRNCQSALYWQFPSDWVLTEEKVAQMRNNAWWFSYPSSISAAIQVRDSIAGLACSGMLTFAGMLVLETRFGLFTEWPHGPRNSIEIIFNQLRWFLPCLTLVLIPTMPIGVDKKQGLPGSKAALLAQSYHNFYAALGFSGPPLLEFISVFIDMHRYYRTTPWGRYYHLADPARYPKNSVQHWYSYLFEVLNYMRVFTVFVIVWALVMFQYGNNMWAIIATDAGLIKGMGYPLPDDWIDEYYSTFNDAEDYNTMINILTNRVVSFRGESAVVQSVAVCIMILACTELLPDLHKTSPIFQTVVLFLPPICLILLVLTIYTLFWTIPFWPDDENIDPRLKQTFMVCNLPPIPHASEVCDKQCEYYLAQEFPWEAEYRFG